MKIRENSSSAYDEIKEISDGIYEGQRDHFAPDMLEVIKKYGNKPRPAPHIMWAMTFSIPTQVKDAFVVGIRYKKPDGTFTEDHMFFQRGQDMKAFSKNELERRLPEYHGTHKGKPDFFEYTGRDGLTSFSVEK